MTIKDLDILHVRLAERARQEGVSMNALVAARIAESVGKRDAQRSAAKVRC